MQGLDGNAEIHVGIKHRADQRSGVGMPGLLPQIFSRQHFHNRSQIHDSHLMGQRLHQGDIVADKADGNLLLPLELCHQLYNGFLHGYIQRRRGFVHNEYLRLQRQRPGNRHPLPLTAGHIVGIAVGKVARQLHHFQKPAAGRILFRFSDAPKIQQRLTYNVPDLHFRVEGSVGVLKYHLDILAVLTQGLAFQFGDVLPTIEDFSLAGRVQRHQKAHKGGLSAAGFSHQTQSLAFVEFQIDIVVRHQRFAAGCGKPPGNVPGFQHNLILFKHSVSLPRTEPRPAVCGCRRFRSG